jgi:hypothetical protein
MIRTLELAEAVNWLATTISTPSSELATTISTPSSELAGDYDQHPRVVHKRKSNRYHQLLTSAKPDALQNSLKPFAMFLRPSAPA